MVVFIAIDPLRDENAPLFTRTPSGEFCFNWSRLAVPLLL